MFPCHLALGCERKTELKSYQELSELVLGKHKGPSDKKEPKWRLEFAKTKVQIASHGGTDRITQTQHLPPSTALTLTYLPEGGAKIATH